MICFGIEAAGKTAGVAVWKDENLLYEATLAAGFTHSESLMEMIDTALKATRLTAAQVELWAICAGPGSFTGLRIGMAAVKGLAFATGAPCVGVSTLEALAWCAAGAATVAPALDARRGQVYAAAFEWDGGDGPRRLLPDGATAPAALREFVETCKKPLVFVGDGADLCYTMYKDVPGVVRWPGFLRASRAAGVCCAALAAAKRGDAVPGEALRPEYHRLSQAERERAARLAAEQ